MLNGRIMTGETLQEINEVTVRTEVLVDGAVAGEMTVEYSDEMEMKITDIKLAEDCTMTLEEFATELFAEAAEMGLNLTIQMDGVIPETVFA